MNHTSALEQATIDFVYGSCLSSVQMTSTGIEFCVSTPMECSTFRGSSDGPYKPQHFSWQGKEVELPPNPWNLLSAMWNKDSLTTSFFYQLFWRGEKEETGLKNIQCKVNKKLALVGYPRRLQKSGSHMLWEDLTNSEGKNTK